MATTVARLEAVLSASTRDFNREMDKAETKTQGVAKGLGAMGKAAIVSGGVAGLAAVAVGAKIAVNAASNLNEQVNKANVVFGKNAKSVQDWSKHLAMDFGLSQRAALEAAGTFGNMLKPMGIMPGKVAVMSKKMTELAGDLASFNNASPEDTLEALRSGLSGEAEPLRKFGVFLNADAINAEALSSGLVKTSVSIADVHVRQTALAKAHQDAAEAVKKYGKGSLEAQTALAKEEYAEKKLHEVLAGKVPKLTAAQKAQATYNLIQKQSKDAHGDFARTSDSLANSQRILKAEFENTAAAVGQKLLPIVATAVSWSTHHWPEIQQKIMEGWQAIRPTFVSFGELVKTVVGLVRKHWGTIGPIVDQVLNIFKTAFRIIGLEFKIFTDILKGNWGEAWQHIKQLLRTVLDQIVNLLRLWKDTFLSAAKALGMAIVNGIWDGIKSLMDWFKGKITGLFDSVIGWVKDALGIKSPSTVFHGIGVNMIKGMVAGVGSMGGFLKDAVVNLVKKIPHPSLSLSHGASGTWQEGLHDRVINAVIYAQSQGWQGQVTSGFRTYAEQSALYQRYLHGGPLAAAPGTSSHESGDAVDVTDYTRFGQIMRRAPAAQKLFNYLGARDPVHYSISGYDKGGWLPPGLSLAMNNTGRPERVLGPNDGGNIVFNFPSYVGSRTELMGWMQNAARQFRRQNGRSPF